MKLISGAKYAALRTRYERTAYELEKSRKLAAERLSTITRQAGEISRLRDARPDTPVQQSRPALGDVELRRQLDLARRTVGELQRRLDEMQASHIADTRELHDLRQGVAL
jgi:hypothetical protein